MNLILNKDNISTLKFNGFEVEKLIYNDVEVWEAKEEVKPYVKLTMVDGSTQTDYYDDGVIPASAYARMEDIQSVEIGDSITEIYSKAFQYCSLIDVKIGSGVTNIKTNAFDYCRKLSSVTIPDSVTSLGQYAFRFCDELTTVNMGANVTTMAASVFKDCPKLTSIDFPNTLTVIPNNTLTNCTSLTSVTIPNSITNIGSNAFSGCTSLTAVTIPNSVTNIDSTAFGGCTSLTAVTIPNSVTNISTHVFKNCSGLTSVTIGSGVTSIGVYTFSGCTSLTSITANTITAPTLGKSAFTDIGNVFDNTPNTGTLYTPNSTEDWTDWLTQLGTGWTQVKKFVPQYGYQVANTLSELSTDDNINYGYTYDNSKWNVLNTDNQYEQYGVFEETDDINSITKYEGKLALSNGHEYQYTNGQWNDVGEASGGFTLVTTLQQYGYWEPDKVFPTNFQVKREQFDQLTQSAMDFNPYIMCNDISVNLYFGQWGQYYDIYDNMTQMSYRGEITQDNEWVYFTNPYEGEIKPRQIDWMNQYTIDIYANQQVIPVQYDNTKFDDYSTVNGYPFASLQDIPVMGKGIVYNIDGYLYKNAERTTENPYSVPYCFSGSTLSEIKLLDENITVIGENAFSYCDALSSVTLGNGIKELQGGAFLHCIKLENIVLPDSLTAIRHHAFSMCSGLTTIEIPSGVTIIERYAFTSCSSLSSVTVPASVLTIEENAFMNCYIKEENFINNSTATGYPWGGNIYKVVNDLMIVCDTEVIGGVDKNITEAIIPDGITTIRKGAFSGYTNLSTVTVPVSVTKIDERTFSGCTNLLSVELNEGITSIGSSAFYNCINLTSITIPNSVTYIDMYAFKGCNNMTALTIGSGIKWIYNLAFWDCTSLTSVTITRQDSDMRIQEYAFRDVPSSGTLYCYKSWFDGLDAYNMSHITEIINWNKVYFDADQEGADQEGSGGFGDEGE